MDLSSDTVATDWIAYSRFSRNAPDAVQARGWLLYEVARAHPVFAWEAIKNVLARYSIEDLSSDDDNEAKRVVGNTAAGPLEDLLANHGTDLINLVEAEARRSFCVRWALGCVWQNAMTDDVWYRVREAPGNVSR